MQFLLKLLDPDTNWLGRDKVQHFASGFIIAAFAVLALDATNPQAFWLNVYGGFMWEGGQTDNAYSATKMGLPMLGKPGFGFGLMDLAADIAGCLLFLGIKHVMNAL